MDKQLRYGEFYKDSDGLDFLEKAGLEITKLEV